MKWLALAVVLGVLAVVGPLMLLLISAGILLAAAFGVILAFVGAVFLAARRTLATTA